MRIRIWDPKTFSPGFGGKIRNFKITRVFSGLNTFTSTSWPRIPCTRQLAWDFKLRTSLSISPGTVFSMSLEINDSLTGLIDLIKIIIRRIYKLVKFSSVFTICLLRIIFSRLSKTSLPEGIVSYIKMCTTSYGKVSQCKIHLTSWQFISNNDKSVTRLPVPGYVFSKLPCQLLCFAGENFYPSSSCCSIWSVPTFQITKLPFISKF